MLLRSANRLFTLRDAGRIFRRDQISDDLLLSDQQAQASASTMERKWQETLKNRETEV
jgi:hypothetical protein